MAADATTGSEFTLVKNELRRRMRSERRAHTAAERSRASRSICNHLTQLDFEAQSAAVYLATTFEANIDAFIRELQAARVLAVAPRMNAGELGFHPIAADWSNIAESANGFRAPVEDGTVAPVAIDQFDIVFVPGLAFDAHGARLGQGGGWYDRVLAKLPSRVLVVGVCFEFQVVEWVPCEEHDQTVSLIVTDQRTLPIA